MLASPTIAEKLDSGRSASLSQQIKALERDLGVRLFERDRRTVTLTAFGETLLPQTRALPADDPFRPGAAPLPE